VLGFELLYKVDDIGWCELQSSVARVNVGLGQVEKPTPGGTTPTFGVKDIEAARKKLLAAGVDLDGEIVTYPGMVRLQTFYDPDRNSLMLYQDLQAA
jgi:predicted enzyme related to lactoylglutathione lyase